MKAFPLDNRMRTGSSRLALCLLALSGIVFWATLAIASSKSLPVLPLQVPSSTLAPPEGNPYGLAVVPSGFGKGTIKPGDLLVSNFNNNAGQQGLGTTIESITPSTGTTGLFFQVTGSQTTGFTNALGVAKAGFVFAGTVLTTDGTDGTAAPGDLYVLDGNGVAKKTISAGDGNLVNGAWGLAIKDMGNSAQIFVSNVFDGTVTRLNVSFKGGVTVSNPTKIADGYLFGLNVGAIVVGPAGLAYNQKKDTLYVAAEDDNAIYAISSASKLTSSGGKGTKIFSDASLNGPLGLVIAPNGDLITVNADSLNGSPTVPSDMIEFTPGGTLVRQFSIDPNPGAGFALLALQNEFAWVDDFTSTVTIFEGNSSHH